MWGHAKRKNGVRIYKGQEATDSLSEGCPGPIAEWDGPELWDVGSGVRTHGVDSQSNKMAEQASNKLSAHSAGTTFLVSWQFKYLPWGSGKWRERVGSWDARARGVRRRA